MWVSTLNYKKGDLLPNPEAQLIDSDGEPIDLTLASSVTVIWKKSGGTANTKEVTVTDALSGSVSWTWTTGDTATAGTYLLEFLIIFPGNRPMHVPNDSTPLTLEIADTLN